MKYLSFFFCLALMASCQPTKEQNTASAEPEDYEWVLQDSVKIDQVGRLQLMDVSPGQKKLLLFGSVTQKIMLTSGDGTILKNEQLNGDIKDSYGEDFIGIGFLNDDLFYIIAYPGIIHVYNEDFEKVKKIDLGFSDVTAASGDWPFHDVWQKDGAASILTFKPGKGEKGLYDPATYQNEKPLKSIPVPLNRQIKITTETGGAKSLYKDAIGWEPESIYRQNPDKFYYLATNPFVRVDNERQELYLCYPVDMNAYVYDLKNDFTLLRTVALDLEKWQEPLGLQPSERGSMRSFHYKKINSVIMGFNLTKEGPDSFIINYRTGLPVDEALPAFPMNASGSDAGRALMKKYYEYRYKVYKNGKPVSTEFSGPRRINGKVMDLNTIYLKDKFPAVEEEYDFEQVYIYALEPKSD